VPLEYNQYAIERDEMEGGAENIALVQQAHGLLWSMGLARTARAWGYFDLPFLIHGVIESVLNRKGFQRREGVDSMTAQGDQRSHTAELGLPYRQLLHSSRFDPPQIPEQSRALSVLGDFLDRMHARGVRVIGGLPTTPDGVQINEPLIAQLRGFFQQCNVFVFPSTWEEPFGISQVEALAAGLLVVSSGTGGAGETVHDDINGRRFQPSNSSDLAQVLRDISRNPQRHEPLRQRARKLAQSHFDTGRETAKLAALIHAGVHRSPASTLFV
jgi:glycosyltransferase involved in cell wall biosynthesis